MIDKLTTVENIVASLEAIHDTLGQLTTFYPTHLDLVTVSVESCAAQLGCSRDDLLPSMKDGLSVSLEDLREDLWDGVKRGASVLWTAFLNILDRIIKMIRGAYKRLRNGLAVVKESLKRRFKKEPSKVEVDALNKEISARRNDDEKKAEKANSWILRSYKSEHHFDMIKSPKDLISYVKLMNSTSSKILRALPTVTNIEQHLMQWVKTGESAKGTFELNQSVKNAAQDLGIKSLTAVSLEHPFTIEMVERDEIALKDNSKYFNYAGKSRNGEIEFDPLEMVKAIETIEGLVSSQLYSDTEETLAKYEAIIKKHTKALTTVYEKQSVTAKGEIRSVRTLLRSMIQLVSLPISASEDIVRAIHSAENVARSSASATEQAKDIDKD